MNGPEHYRAAGQVLAQAENRSVTAAAVAAYTAVAQVHATLALTAAVIARGSMTLADRHEWQMAIDPERAAEQAAPSPAQQPGGTS